MDATMRDRPVWMLALIDILAVHRLTRLVVVDDIAQPLRERIIAWSYADALDGDPPSIPTTPTMWQDFADDDGDPPKVAALITCRWCSSIWVAAVVVAARRRAPAVWAPLAAVLALSTASTLLARIED